MQFVNDLHGLISPTPQGTPLPLVLLGKVGIKNFYKILKFKHSYSLPLLT